MRTAAISPGSTRVGCWLFVAAVAGVCLLPASASAQEKNAFTILRERFSGKKATDTEQQPETKLTEAPTPPVVIETEAKESRSTLQAFRDRLFGKKKLPEAADGVILRDGQLQRETRRDGVYLELEGAKKLYQDEKFDDAMRVLNSLTRNTKLPPSVVEEALFYKCECQYRQGNYREAKSNYIKLLRDFRSSARFQAQSTQRLFDIANYWLDDVRREMQEREQEKLLVMPASFVNFSNSKPFLDVEGHALQALDEVRLNDINGPLGEKALFYIATVKFYRRDYTNADYYYSQLYENHPKSDLAPKAVKQAIVCKQMMAHGCVYDNRPIEEARQLVDTAARAFPEVNKGDEHFLEQQLVKISQQQAERDYEIAQFYKRTGHPGSAYFYYELVRRRYPNTKLAEQAMAQMNEIRAHAQTKHAEDTETATPEPREPGRLRLPDIINPASWRPKD